VEKTKGKTVNPPGFILALLPYATASALLPHLNKRWNGVQRVVEGSMLHAASADFSPFWASQAAAKTEITPKGLAKMLPAGKRGICVIPEIALDPANVERLRVASLAVWQ